MTIPATGTTAIPRNGTEPVAATIASTGTVPARIGNAAAHPVWSRVIRRPEVQDATPNISATNATVAGQDSTTATITPETTASCATARPTATTDATDTPSRPAAATATVRAVNASSGKPSPHPTTMVEPPMTNLRARPTGAMHAHTVHVAAQHFAKVGC